MFLSLKRRAAHPHHQGIPTMADHIQVGDAVPRVQYAANGSQTAFTFTFPIFTAADLEVWLDGIKQAASAYSISGIGISGGGTVLFTIPPANGAVVTLRRKLAITRTGDYQEDGIIRAKVLNDELDYQTAALQQVAEDTNRAVKRSFLSSNTADLTLPEPSAGKAIKWNADATGLENSAADADTVLSAAEAAAAAAAASQSSASAAATAASASASGASAAAISAATQAASAAASAMAAGAAASGGVKISPTDTTADYLNSKLVAGANLALTPSNAGGNETLNLAVTGLGSAAALASDADTALAANSDNRLPTQRAVRAYVAANAGASAAEITALQQDIVQNYLLDAITGAWAAGSYGNGGYDAFNSDTIGGTSTGHTYDGSSKLYGNPGGYGADVTGGKTYYASAVAAGSAAGVFNDSTDYAAPANGWTPVNSANYASPYWVAVDLGAGVTKIAAKVRLHSQYTGSRYIPKDFKLQGSNNSTNGSDGTWTDVYCGTAADNDTWQEFTFANAVGYRWYRIWSTNTQSGQYPGLAEAEIIELASPLNMTLVSSALSPTPVSAPDQIKLMVLWKDMSGSAVLNTDVTAEATRDGATWSAGTLSDTGLTVSGFKVLWAVVDVSGQPGGTTVKYRLKTLNAKSQQVKGTALMTK
jgi:hypothetical protein